MKYATTATGSCGMWLGGVDALVCKKEGKGNKKLLCIEENERKPARWSGACNSPDRSSVRRLPLSLVALSLSVAGRVRCVSVE